VSAELCIQAFVAIYVLIDPIGRSIFFRTLTANEPERRPEYVRKLVLTVAITLGVSALAGKQLLDLIGIDLGAFGVAGGIVLAGMGFEMLAGGQPSRAQGGSEAHEQPEPASASDSIIVPYAIPFMCGPGAITAVITIASSTDNWSGTGAALIAIAIVVALIPVGHLWLVNKINLSDQALALVTRLGGLFVATIGIQLVLNGLRTYYGF
jgi:multiple antibiotic resistance protein